MFGYRKIEGKCERKKIEKNNKKKKKLIKIKKDFFLILESTFQYLKSIFFSCYV